LKIHAIQTGTVSIRPHQRVGTGFGPLRLINTLTDRRWTEPLPIWVWVIEHPEGIIVIDTGETSRATRPGYFPAWHPYFKNVKEQLTPDQEIGPQLQAIGIQPNDVRRVVMTHLHTDHAGGLQHFPKSEILIMRRAFDRAIGFRGQLRGFLPQRWPIGFTPTLIDLEPQPFGSFPSSLKLTHAGDVIIVPTSGHTEAHISVILQNSDHTVFFAGDASYTQQLMLDERLDGVALNARAARETLQRIHQFSRSTPTIYLPTHDPQSADRLAKNTVV
jgi:N-acyl homoserine lactone hydrolase